VFENKVLRIIFGPMWDKVARGWRRLHNEVFHNLYDSSNVIREVMMARACRTQGTKRNAYKI
jgi:hypothetical protein